MGKVGSKMNKKGWIHILEATIAVMIVAGVMVAVYSDQLVRDELTVADYSYALQTEILDSITIRSDLRLDILNVVNDNEDDENFRKLNNIVAAEIPASFGHLLRVCNLGESDENSINYCNMPEIIFTATLDKNVFVEETIISSELGSGSVSDVIYEPKKVRLFLWEGEADFGEEGECVDECTASTYSLGSYSSCSLDYDDILSVTCGDTDGDGCLEKVISREQCGEESICDANTVSCIEETCSDRCQENKICHLGNIFEITCEVSDDGCLDVLTSGVIESCGELGCEDGACVGADDSGVTDNSVDKLKLTCEKKVLMEKGCDHKCTGYDIREKTNTCNFYTDNFYNCYDIETETTKCTPNPKCSSGYTLVESKSCD